MADIKRQLVIKTGAVKRLSKELELYEKERSKEAEKVEALKRNGADSHDIKHAEDVLAEATMMVPDTRQRLSNALQELISTEENGRSSLSDTEEYKTGVGVLNHAKQLLAV